MRIVIAGDYPENPPTVVGGIQAVIYYTLPRLSDYQDLDLHVVTCEKWRSSIASPLQAVHHGRWTVHFLPSSPRIPHTLSMLTIDRWAVRRKIDALTPDLVHAHGQTAAYPFAGFDSGLPTLVTVHGISMLEAQVDRRGSPLKSRLRIALWSAVERACLRRARDIVVISPFVRQAITPYTKARLHVVDNPVHSAFFGVEPAPTPGKVLMVGTIRRAKGTLEAIKAMALVRQRFPQAELYVAGGFTVPFREYSALVKEHLSASGAASYVHVLGYLDHTALLDAYRTSQILLFPSWQESSPVAVAEAMAAGLPCIVSDIGGTRHLVEDGVTGYRVPAGDVHAFADSIIRLLGDPAACARFGQRAREVARQRFSEELAARRTHDLYLELARGS